jgi:hypothetical protein
MKSRLAFLLALSLFMAACGNSSKSGSDPTSSSSLAGNWQISLQPADSKATRSESGFLLDNNGTLTGNVLLTDYPCSGVGSVSGTVDGTDVTLVADPVGVTVNMTGTTGSQAGSMSGTYTMLSDGCTTKSASPESGAWAATLVASLTGTITTGSFTSSKGPTFSVTGSVSQGQNSGASAAPLTGSLTLTPVTVADPCVPDSASITGSISGTAVVLNLFDPSSGSQLGQATGTISVSGTSDSPTFSGKYDILGQPTVKGCHSENHGTVTFTLQSGS